jgi:hypothetical protein
VDPRSRDHADAAQDLARDLADIAHQLASLKGEAHAWLRDPNYDTLKHRLEDAYAVRWRLLRWRPGAGCVSTRGGSGERRSTRGRSAPVLVEEGIGG